MGNGCLSFGGAAGSGRTECCGLRTEEVMGTGDWVMGLQLRRGAISVARGASPWKMNK
jgi:hypothetical protein